jgi:hypothetical protein
MNSNYIVESSEAIRKGRKDKIMGGIGEDNKTKEKKPTGRERDNEEHGIGFPSRAV